MEMNKNRYACWDLDKTSGLFVKNSETSEETQIEEEKLGVRAGLKAALCMMAKRNYTHFITTSRGSRREIEGLLDDIGIRPYFDRVFDGGDLIGDEGKNYDVVIARLGLKKEKAMKRMIVMGDEMKDMPRGNPLLFVHQRDGYLYDAGVVARIAEFFENVLIYDVWNSFSVVHDKAERDRLNQRRINLGDISFSVEYTDNKGVAVPRIFDIDCDRYRTPVIPLDE